MEMVALTMLGIGSALGLRFRIFVLLPVILLGLFVCTAFGLAQGTTIWSIMLTNVVGATCLQIGYLGGALLKFLIFSGRFDGTRSSQSARLLQARPSRSRLPNSRSGGLPGQPSPSLRYWAQVSVLFPIHLL